MSDISSLVLHWREAGVAYVNADVTLSLARPPRLDGIGAVARTGRVDSGFSVGTTVLFDRSGPVGATVVSALPAASAAALPSPGGATTQVSAR